MNAGSGSGILRLRRRICLAPENSTALSKEEFKNGLFNLDLSPIFSLAASRAAPEPGNFASALAREISRLG
jgi:hypothetical protein